MPTFDTKRTSKTPTHARTPWAAALLALLLLLPRPAVSQETGREALSEADVVRLALERAPTARLARAQEQVAEARARTAAPFANPSLSWSRETVETGPAAGLGSQDIFVASVPIEVAGPLAARSAEASESAWMRSEASLQRSSAVLQALLAFYELAAAERRVELRTESLEHLDEAGRVLGAREAAGNASGYETGRLDIEAELSRSRLAEAHIALRSARVRLGSLLGLPPETLHASHELLTTSSEPPSSRSDPEHTAIQHAKASIQHAAQAQDRAAWTWLPSLELGGGVKRADNTGAESGFGYVLGVTLGLPLFDHGRAARARAEAQQELASARAGALEAELERQRSASQAQLHGAREELTRFEATTARAVRTVLTAARSGYREGERTILELLDAQRAATEVAERRLQLRLIAKRAEAHLRAAAGDLP